MALLRASPAGPANALERKIKMGRVGMERGFHYNHSFCHAGAVKKPLPQTWSRRWCLTRLWTFVVVFASLFFLVSISSFGTLMPGKTVYPRTLKSVYPLNSRSSSQLLWDYRTEEMFASSFNALPWQSSKNHPRALTSHAGTVLRGFSSDGSSGEIVTGASNRPYIEDMVAVEDDLDLVIVRHGLPAQTRISACKYGGKLTSSVQMVDFLPDGRLSVKCTRPILLQRRKLLNPINVSLELDGGVGSPIEPGVGGFLTLSRWDEALVYAAQSTDEDVVLYVKNAFDAGKSKKASEYTDLDHFRCKFGDSVETAVTAGAQEVFRCEKPTPDQAATLSTRVKVHLVYNGKSLASIAYYQPVKEESTVLSREAAALKVISPNFPGEVTEKKYHVCSCTMVWNVAKFLKEWVLYNSDLGVEKFFLYDNNSEDGIRKMVKHLSKFNVSRISWPWVKTQEAGFAHCAVEAQRECSWILFTDVDEYLFPKRWLQLTDSETTLGAARSAASSPLVTLIDDTLARVKLPAVGNTTEYSMRPPPLQIGQISFQCRNFGPSGRTSHPYEGVTQGYTCRDHRDQRHKSMIYFPALKSSLQNVIHHFYLKPRYQTVYLDMKHAVVNHYKFQAWSEFQKKYTKRASTYVTDWKEPKNLNSKDRPEGLGPDPKKPSDWESRHCEVQDTALRYYTRRRFGMIGNGDYVTMAWEL